MELYKCKGSPFLSLVRSSSKPTRDSSEPVSGEYGKYFKIVQKFIEGDLSHDGICSILYACDFETGETTFVKSPVANSLRKIGYS